ncbi:MAG: O-methyltransferase [Anaerolineales bacterium]|nr:O-methyltransferase [Anaerolineales bacterium]
MLQDIPKPILDRMKYLEAIDARDRTDGTPRPQRLRQIPPETGRFIALLATIVPPGRTIEIGTSAGYSTLWLCLAGILMNRKITTYEIMEEKADLAQETFEKAGVTRLVTLVRGDALDYVPRQERISFCFLDAEKEVYAACYEAVIPKMVTGGILAADNAINHQATLKPMLERVQSDKRVDSLIVPVGKGVLVCRKL